MQESQSTKTTATTEIYEGKLQCNKQKNKKGRDTYSYCVYNKAKATNDNITEILDTHYKNENIVHIRVNSIHADDLYMLEARGILEYQQEDGIWELFLSDTKANPIININMDTVLWNLVGDIVSIDIEAKEKTIEVTEAPENGESEDIK